MTSSDITFEITGFSVMSTASRPWIPLIVMLGVGACAIPANAATEYAWDFRTGYFDNVSLAPHGKAATKLLQPQKDGLHIAIPGGEEITFVGFTPRFQVQGNFEVTLQWSVKAWKQPKAGYGTGPSLYLTTEGEFQPAASIGRVLRADGRSVYSVFVARGVDGERKVSVKLFDSDARAGQLRIKRVKEQLEFAVSDGASTDFRVLHEQEFAEGDVNLLRAGLQQSDSSASSEAVIGAFSVNATKLPHLPSEQKRTEPLYAPRYNPPPTPVSYVWLWRSLIAAGLAVVAVVWVVRRRS